MAPYPVDSSRGSSTLFEKLRDYYIKQDVPAPSIAPHTALLCAALYTLVYVAPFYLSPTLRSTPLQSRDAPAVIRARVRAVALSCLFSTVVTVYVLAIHGQKSPPDIARLLGFWPIDPVDLARVLGLVAILFAGPLYETSIVNSAWRQLSISTLKAGLYDNWIGYRNLVVAPASEELVFRSLTISLSLLAKVNPSRIVFITPLIFGLAHVHHLVEFLQSRTPPGHRSPPLPVWINGLVRTLFQFTYTSLFGFFAAFVYLRTGNVYAVTLAHTFCNWMGVPRLWGRVGQFAADYEGITPDVAQGKRDEDAGAAAKGGGDGLTQGEDGQESKASYVRAAGPQNLGVGWTVVYYALMLMGSYGFYRMLWPLTESSNSLASFS
ncbi:CAAX prenyl protease [Friedmanniomyces endolithicus]|uniref:intramembrane prenyl-peptidase Rce1 n=1 Tax=Rachicladosporium monterosium TaxID=1507873 RepID=A0ABR0LFK0_9PEZI|nr:CAAX prenyl protease [Friedmanniomyces endolithicus]KAK5147474.1 CAAX prenyl protease [Rachicladosporium monterosium]